MATRALGLDLGSSSVRAIVFESSGPAQLSAVPGALARRPRHLVSTEPGQATFDADGYLSDLVACVDELQATGCLDGVSDVALDSQWHSVLAVDREGRPQTDVISWADTRPRRPEGLGLGAPEARGTGVGGGGGEGPGAGAAGAGGRGSGGKRYRPVATPEALEDLRQRTGCAFAPMYWTWRVPWLLAAAPHGAGGGPFARFLGLSEYVGLQLLSDPSMSVSMASGTGLLFTAERRWDEEALELAGIGPGLLPELAPPGWEGRLTATWGRRWPELAQARWHPALGDGAAANLGVGCDGPSRAAITIGTSAAVRLVTVDGTTARPRPLGRGDGAGRGDPGDRGDLGGGPLDPGRPAAYGDSPLSPPGRPGLPHLPAGLWRYCVDYERVVTGAAYSSGGQLYAWALSLWQGSPAPGGGGSEGTHAIVAVPSPLAEAEGGKPNAASSAGWSRSEDEGRGAGATASVRFDVTIPVAAGSDGVMVLPWQAGTRPPAPLVPAGRGAVVGLGLTHTGAHIVSATVEAVCFQLAGGLADLESGTGQRLEVIVNGGAIERTGWWRGRLAAALARRVVFSSVPETTARGAVAAALGVEVGAGEAGAGEVGAGEIEREVVEPAPADVAALALARRRWAECYGRLLPMVASPAH